jgi:tetratricopeptide (TPR) repeat protein
LQLEDKGRWDGDGYHILGTIQALRCEWDRALRNFDMARDIRRRLADTGGHVESTVQLGLVYQHLGDWPKAARLFEEAVNLAKTMDPSPAWLVVRRTRGLLRLRMGDAAGAADDLKEAIALADTMPETIEYGPTLRAWAEFLTLHGDTVRAIQSGESAAQHAATAEHQVDASLQLADLYISQQDWKRAARQTSIAVDIATRLKAPRLMSLAKVLSARGAAARDAKAATSIFEAAVHDAEAAHCPFERARALCALARHIDSDPRQTTRAAAALAEAHQVLDHLFAGLPVAAAATAS